MERRDEKRGSGVVCVCECEKNKEFFLLVAHSLQHCALLTRYSTARCSVLQLVRASQAEQKRRKNVRAKHAKHAKHAKRRVEMEGGVVCRENE
jgi:hypothetical protein